MPVKKPALVTTLVLLAWLLFLTLAIRVFGPDSDYVLFDSDAAIPILTRTLRLSALAMGSFSHKEAPKAQIVS